MSECPGAAGFGCRRRRPARLLGLSTCGRATLRPPCRELGRWRESEAWDRWVLARVPLPQCCVQTCGAADRCRCRWESAGERCRPLKRLPKASTFLLAKKPLWGVLGAPGRLSVHIYFVLARTRAHQGRNSGAGRLDHWLEAIGAVLSTVRPWDALITSAEGSGEAAEAGRTPKLLSACQVRARVDGRALLSLQIEQGWPRTLP